MGEQRQRMQPCILIVDDDTEVRAVIAEMLGPGYRVLMAGDGAAGLAQVAAESVNLVILDVTMPGIDGWEVCRRIKTDPATQDIGVIMLTARSPLRDELEMAQAHPDGFLNKPFDRADLFGQVAACLGKR